MANQVHVTETPHAAHRPPAFPNPGPADPKPHRTGGSAPRAAPGTARIAADPAREERVANHLAAARIVPRVREARPAAEHLPSARRCSRSPRPASRSSSGGGRPGRRAGAALGRG